MDLSIKNRNTPNSSRRTRYWDLLVKPHPSITEVGNRQQAQLMAVLSLAIGLLNIMGIIAITALNHGITNSVKMLVVLMVVCIVTYLLSRSRFYLASGVVISVTLSALGFVGALSEVHPIESVLFFVPFAYILAMGTLPWQWIAVFTVLNVAGAFALPKLTSAVDSQSVFTLLGQYVTTGGLAMVVAVVRNNIERVRLRDVRDINKQLNEMNAMLEQRVLERTRDIAMAADVGRAVSQVKDMQAMLSDAANLIRDRFELYHVQIYLTDPPMRNLILRASTGEAGQEMLRRGHRLPVSLTSINGTAAAERRVVIVADTQKGTFFFPNPLLPETRSEMCIPMLSGERVVGVLDLQSDQAGSLAEVNLPAFEILAGQLTTSLLNSELFVQVEQSLSELEARTRLETHQGWVEYLDAIERPERLAYQYDQYGVQVTDHPLFPTNDPCIMNMPIIITGEPVGAFQFSGEKPWTSLDKEMVDSVTAQVAQQIENLRLLSQAQRYREEAESAVRRLTRQEWDKSVQQLQPGEVTFAYVGGRVQSLSNNLLPVDEMPTFEIKVQEEPIGRIGIAGPKQLTSEDTDLVAQVGAQLGAHLENMRLYTSAQREIQEREKAEQAMEVLMGNLESQQRTLQAVLDNMPVGVLMTEMPSGRMLLTNRRSEEILGTGISPNVVGEARKEVFPVYKRGSNVRYTPQSLMDDVGLSDNVRTIDDAEVRREDGSRVLLQVSGAPVLDSQGNATAFVLVIQDITQIHEAQETIAKRAVELATVAEVATRVATIQNPDEMLQTVVNLTRLAFSLYHAHIYLLNPSEDLLVLAKGSGEIGQKMVAEGRQIPINAEVSLVARAARNRSGVIANDVRAAPEFLPHPLLPDTRSELAVPMIAGDHLLVVLDIQDSILQRFTPEDVNIMTTLAAQVAVSLQNARSFARAQRQAEREALINTINERIQATTSVESALQVAIREIGRALGAQHAAIRLGVEKSPAIEHILEHE